MILFNDMHKIRLLALININFEFEFETCLKLKDTERLNDSSEQKEI